MKKVIKYKCDYCAHLFSTEELCVEHEEKHSRTDKANQMLSYGCTLKEIQDECNIWYEVPKYLENVNKDNCFKISHWQCCDKPVYKITGIGIDGTVSLWGCGSWTGYYGNNMRLDNRNLVDPRPKEELFVDKRYGEKLKQGG